KPAPHFIGPLITRAQSDARVDTNSTVPLSSPANPNRDLSMTKPGEFGKRSALNFVLLFGVVNLFADMTYEGARSVTGPFLGLLGASALVVGSVTGFGEFLGYALR